MTSDAPRLPLELDPLIAEAKRRMRRRRGLVIGALVVAAATAVTLALALRPPPAPPAPKTPPQTTHQDLRTLAHLREREAASAAERLLRSLPLPAGSRPVSDATGRRVVHRPNLGINTFTQYAYRHAFWRVPSSLRAVMAFLKRHSPPTFRNSGPGYGATMPYQGVSFIGPQVGGRVPNRLVVALVPQHGGTMIRVEAGVVWTYPRPARLMIPRGAREVDIRSLPGGVPPGWGHATPVTRRVTEQSQVARIVHWFNALNVVQPNTYTVGCVLLVVVPVRFVFRSASGRELASAIVPATPADSCYAIQFTLRGQGETRLVDSTPEDGMAFYNRVERLLGVRFGPLTNHP